VAARGLGLPLDPERPVLPQVRESRPGEIAVAAVASVLGGCVLAGSASWVPFAVLGVAFFALLGALRPAVFLGLFLLVRPLLDEISDVTVGARSANLGGALAIALILTAVLVAVRRRRLTWPTAATALLLALAVTVVSAAQALLVLGPKVGATPLAEVLRIGALCAAYVLAANVFAAPEKVRWLFTVVGLSAVAPAVLGIAEWIGGPPLAQGLDVVRISGPFVGPVPFGMFLAVAALILLFLPRDQLRPVVRIAAVAPILAALVGTSSRTGWFIFAAGVLLLGARARKQLVVAIAVLLVALVALVPSVRERALPASNPPAGVATEQTYSSWVWRQANSRTLLEKWRERPVFGYGLRTTAYVNPRTPFASRGQTGAGFAAHNLVVRLLVEGGVVLLAAYALFFAVLLRSVWRMVRDPWELQALGRVLCVIWALLLVVAVAADDPLDATAVIIPLLALTGSLDVAHRAWVRQHLRGSAR
jgi:O-antigen ligase